MKITEGKVVLGATILPVVALAVFFLGATPAAAIEPVCYYAGQGYSSGAQISNACANGNHQICSGGMWGRCE